MSEIQVHWFVPTGGDRRDVPRDEESGHRRRASVSAGVGDGPPDGTSSSFR